MTPGSLSLLDCINSALKLMEEEGKSVAEKSPAKTKVALEIAKTGKDKEEYLQL